MIYISFVSTFVLAPLNKCYNHMFPFVLLYCCIIYNSINKCYSLLLWVFYHKKFWLETKHCHCDYHLLHTLHQFCQYICIAIIKQILCQLIFLHMSTFILLYCYRNDFWTWWMKLIYIEYLSKQIATNEFNYCENFELSLTDWGLNISVIRETYLSRTIVFSSVHSSNLCT